jgi:hypothetical protein
MNVWAVKKALPLKVLLLELVHRYGENRLALNNQESHDQAIELSTVRVGFLKPLSPYGQS